MALKDSQDRKVKTVLKQSFAVLALALQASLVVLIWYSYMGILTLGSEFAQGCYGFS